jgi:hypothetical protein
MTTPQPSSQRRCLSCWQRRHRIVHRDAFSLGRAHTHTHTHTHTHSACRLRPTIAPGGCGQGRARLHRTACAAQLRQHCVGNGNWPAPVSTSSLRRCEGLFFFFFSFLSPPLAFAISPLSMLWCLSLSLSLSLSLALSLSLVCVCVCVCVFPTDSLCFLTPPVQDADQRAADG